MVRQVAHGGLKIGNLVLQRGQVAVDTVVEVADVVLPAQLEFPTGVVHGTGIHGRGGDSHFGHRRDAHQQVPGVLVVPVHTQGEAVVQETGVHTEVRLHGGLPRQVRIGQAVRLRAQGKGIVLAELIVLAVEGNRGGIRITGKDGDVTVDTPGAAELQEADEIRADVVLEERLVGHGPTGGNGREIAPAVLGRELGGVERVRAEVRLEAVAIVIAVGQTAEIGDLGALARAAAADALRTGTVVLGEVSEILGITLQRILTGQAGSYAAAVGVSWKMEYS